MFFLNTITYKVDSSKHFLSSYDQNEIRRIVSDWKYNVDMAFTKFRTPDLRVISNMTIYALKTNFILVPG